MSSTTETELKKKIQSLEEEAKRLRNAAKKRKYGLVWMEVPEAFEGNSEHQLPTLKEVPKKAIVRDDGKPAHILIEGDNYHALTCLNYTHRERVDLIYIDPPYNTGDNSFRYRDKRLIDKFPDGTPVPKDSPFRHSYWLSFMAKRLKLARELLKDTGVIFINIDDNEAAQLKLLCDEIFLAGNFIAQVCWQKKFSPQPDAKNFSDMHDFILVYAKNLKNRNGSDIGLVLQGLDRTEQMKNRYSNPDNDPRGPWTSSDLTVKTYCSDYDFPITTPSGRVVNPPASRCWMTSEDRIKELIKDNRIWFGKSGNNVPRLKTFLSQVRQRVTPSTWWAHMQVGHNQEAKQELKQILPDADKIFDTPKPVRLMKRIIQLATKPNEGQIILDFFAGSGTTAQAILELNSEQGGNRQFIMVTNNEDNICLGCCYPRIKNVIEGYDFQGKKKELLIEHKITWTEFRKAEQTIDQVNYLIQENDETQQWDNITKEIKDGVLRVFGEKQIDHKMPGHGNSLKYFTTTFVGKNNVANATDEDKVELAHQAGGLLAITENTLFKVSKNEYYQLFENEDRYTAVYFREELTKFDEFFHIVEDLEYPVTVYIFSWGEDEFDAMFDHIEDVEVKPIPQPILEIYKSIYGQG